MIGGCCKEGEKDKEWDWREVARKTDRFSEIIFNLTMVADKLDACGEYLSEINEFHGGSLLDQIEKAEIDIRKKADEWADDPIFQAEIKCRLDVLQLQKKYVKESLERIGNKLPYLLKYLSVLTGEGKEQ